MAAPGTDLSECAVRMVFAYSLGEGTRSWMLVGVPIPVAFGARVDEKGFWANWIQGFFELRRDGAENVQFQTEFCFCRVPLQPS